MDHLNLKRRDLRFNRRFRPMQVLHVLLPIPFQDHRELSFGDSREFGENVQNTKFCIFYVFFIQETVYHRFWLH